MLILGLTRPSGRRVRTEEKMSKTKINIITYSGIVLFLCLLYFILYFIRFHNGLSYDQNDFSIFGSYLSGLSAILTCITLLFLIISYVRDNKEKTDLRKKEIIKFTLDGFGINQEMFDKVYRYSDAKKIIH
jgi:hypothetical protein